MIPASHMRPREPIYTWVADDGTNVHIASERLYHWVQTNAATLTCGLIPIDFTRGQDYLRDNIASIDRCLELLSRDPSTITPMIFGERGTYTDGAPDVFHIDGHHRYALYAMCQIPQALAYLLTIDQWKPFQIEGLPNTTQQALAHTPILRRSY